MKLTLALLVVTSAFAQDKPADIAKLKLDLKLADLKSLVLQEQLVVKNLEQVRGEIESKRVEVCKEAHVDPAPTVCQINLNDKTVVAAKPEAPTTQTQGQTQAKKP
jgi:hypothetical protein